MSSWTKIELFRWAGIGCVAVGGLTASGFPPFDPSVWLMMFGLGMIVGTFPQEKNNE